jgi:hypothetical protein
MLRHIISAGLAMTACVTFIPTKANAVNLTLVPVGSLQRNPGDSIEFVLAFNPVGINTPVTILNVVTPNALTPTGFDGNELSFDPNRSSSVSSYTLSGTTNIANFFFTVLPGVVKDGNADVFRTIVNYSYKTSPTTVVPGQVTLFSGGSSTDVQPVPEPLTIFGTAIGLGCGVLFKRKSFKKRLS